MRRAQNENSEIYSTNVFSNEAWTNITSTQTLTEIDEVYDLSKYAATSLPDTFSNNTRPSRFTPSPHSSHYEESPSQSNSQGNPFDHSAYDGRPQARLSQNVKYDEMPTSVRKQKLGGSSIGSSLANNTAFSPLLPPLIPQARTIEDSELTQVWETTAAGLTETPSTIRPSAEPEESKTLISDFEQEFLDSKHQSNPDSEVFTSLSSGVIQAREPITFASDLVFGTQHLDISDSDRLYRDTKNSRDPLQIDLDFFKTLISKIPLKIGIITLVSLLIVVFAFVILKPSTSATNNSPRNNTESSSSESNKIVIEPGDTQAVPSDPSIVIPGTQSGTIVKYDENGNAVYSGQTHDNFNGE